MPLLTLDHVSKTYRTNGAAVTALRDVSLAVEAGRFVALAGRSGCGKTTLLNLAGAMDFPSSGEVLIDGVTTTGLGDAALTRLRRAHVGFIFQLFHLLPTLSVVENVELPLLLAGRSGARGAALESLRWVELEDLAGRMPHQLSGGQMQRVAIARALVHSPKLLLADEPIGNLDTATGSTVVALLRRIARERGAAVLMATHSMESAAACDAIVRLRDGRIEEIEPR
ncbi:MAG: ABC transporter ATP-binding protein [Bryobacteraceae bacterium]|nr:ABC transporter ATP-binding protein [Bryobacteraceae bacterium]